MSMSSLFGHAVCLFGGLPKAAVRACKGVLDLHGGTIEARRSHGPGQSSEFIVHLPFSASGADGAPASAADTPPVATMRRRVIVVDYNKDAADALAMLLEPAGHEVRVAHPGRAALALAQTFRPDVLPSDYRQP